MAKDTELSLKDLSGKMSSPVEMKHANQSIPIYEGEFQLKQDQKSFSVNGVIHFNWFPTPGAKFYGKVESTNPDDLWYLALKDNKFIVIIAGLVFGESRITNISNTNIVEGNLVSDVVKGDKTVDVTKVSFAIPNLRKLLGFAVRPTLKSSSYSNLNMIKLENDDYFIIMDQLEDFESLNKSLKSHGGYICLYFGEIIKKKGSINFSRLQELISCLSAFLTFVNGRRCAPLFLRGIHDDKILWQDFTRRRVDQYKYVKSWADEASDIGLEKAWQSFSFFWKNKENKDFLNTAVHWYVEANSNSGMVEGSIMMAQAALELLYNWLVLEKNKLLLGKDGENISAANKIRLLLSQIKVKKEVPSSLIRLQSFVNKEKEEKEVEIVDGPGAFVSIRNAIVHSQLEKRKKLMKIDDLTKYEALQLSLQYIELSLLYILDYEGSYTDRCST